MWLILRAMFPQTQNCDGEKSSKVSLWRNHWPLLPPRVTPLTPGQLQQHWRKTHPSRGKQGFLQILLFTPVSCVECIDSISYFLNHKTRCAPSRPIYRDWIHAIAKMQNENKISQESWDKLMFGALRVSWVNCFFFESHLFLLPPRKCWFSHISWKQHWDLMGCYWCEFSGEKLECRGNVVLSLLLGISSFCKQCGAVHVILHWGN